MILAHNYSGGAGKCQRCGTPRRHGIYVVCETPDENEALKASVVEGEQS